MPPFALLLAGLLFSALGITFALFIGPIDFFSFYFTLFLTPLFLFSDVFFPLDERLTPLWQWMAELLPLLHPVRLARGAFRGSTSPWLMLWDITYILSIALALLWYARTRIRARLTS